MLHVVTRKVRIVTNVTSTSIRFIRTYNRTKTKSKSLRLIEYSNAASCLSNEMASNAKEKEKDFIASNKEKEEILILILGVGC